MAKSRSSNFITKSVPTVTQTSILYPIVSQATTEEFLSDEDIDRLQKVSQIEFKKDVRRALGNIAVAWRRHDRALQSARPKKFRARFRKMEIALKKAVALLELDDAADSLDYQLLIWLINARFEGAADFLTVAVSVSEQTDALINLLRRAQENLPKDMGRARPKDDERFIIYLADQFESSGGKALAYRVAKSSGSRYQRTAFRNFIHHLYKLLSLASRRTESGLDEAIIRALRYRRKGK
jgi:hypothetical protein